MKMPSGSTMLFALLAGMCCAVAPEMVRGSNETSAHREWAIHPAIVEIQTAQDVYALGDVHGDYQRMAELLAAARLIEGVPAFPASVKWSGGKGVLVILGDLIDKYDHSLDVIACLRALQRDAARQGGRVIVTMGNHEAEFLASGGKTKKAVSIPEQLAQADARGRKSPTLAAELKAAGIAPAEVATGNDSQGIGEFLRDLPIAARINDWFFCHAGNTHGATLTELRDSLEKGINSDGFGATILADPDSLLDARMHPHPWWEVGGKKARDLGGALLRTNLEALGCRHLVFGHQPGDVVFDDGTRRDRDQIFTKFDGRVFLIDTGMSRGVDAGRAALLKISRGDGPRSSATATAVYADGVHSMLWSEVPSP